MGFFKKDGNNEEQQNEPQYKIEKKVDLGKKRKIIRVSIISTIIILIILICMTGFALANIGNTKILSNVKINNIEIQGLTKSEALEVIKEKLNFNLEKDILLKSGEFEYKVRLKQLETTYNVEKAIENAYKVGRSGNIFKNNFEIIKSMINGTEIEIEATYNEELLNEVINDIAVKIPDAVKQSSYYVEDNKLIVTKGKEGNTVNKEELKNEIISNIYVLEDGINIELSIYKIKPEDIDLDKIYSEVHVEPKNAYYTKEPFQVYPHINGIDFDLNAAKEKIKEEDKEEYVIDLKITVPEITTNKIGTEAFPDLLSSFSTKYDASNVNRSTNLKLAANKINGTVLMPGEIFSYNKVVGERTINQGYREANGFSGGGVVQMLGGGICQIASTLYDAALYANLDIVDRTNHMYSAGYVGAGKDATVVYGSIDFKFKNSRKYPIMIKASVGNGIAKMEIFGIKEEVEYEVVIESKILNYIPFSTVYQTDNNLAPGKEVVSQNGMQGMKSITYKVLKLNGKEVSREVLSTDTYKAMNKIIKRGPAAVTPVEPPVVEKPVETPEPEPVSEPEIVPEASPEIPIEPPPIIPETPPEE